ncbi:L-threonylcarbamoyladenylate synthase [Polymorphum gilvum]|uniref:Threonylcarbamoyl-AMP synthase n=1 Tax=Polymorphum gilvum (strain LMG 25793 / CGMCC 1.9160 / SL003B-26A1) TaxID=991905 RepID=F2IYA4_POLGS|nr:L-threonylcarbamoyladenylate synthase [Polymorphum gilvum]ADZ71716.1 Probable translation factor sua5 protein [Polymorphum gilvum SL003B-26A1]
MQRWSIDPNDPNWRQSPVAAAVCEALLAGNLVGVPTETVYGLAADATNGRACAAIYAAKGRPRFNPLISHLESLDAARRHGVFDARAHALAQAFWPGPLTLVVPKAAGSPICDLVTAGLDTVALRVPAAPVMRFLAERTGRPLAAPSANLSGRISATTADDVIRDLGDAVAFVIDAGPCPIGIESTIVGLAGAEPVLLRPGGIAREAIERVLGRPLAAAQTEQADAPQAPGMLTSHYAPNATVRLAATEVASGEALLAFGPTPPAGVERAVATVNLSPTGDLAEAAATLFSALRRLDASGAATICVQPIPDGGLGEAINDRLRRAAAPRHGC